MPKTTLPLLPPPVELETKNVLRQLAGTNRALAELKGFANTIPNRHILINAITLNEAKDSSAIENIITTHDELYRGMTTGRQVTSAAKEVINYRRAIWHGFNLINKHNMLTVNMIADIQSIIEGNSAGIRSLPGTVLINEFTGDVVYTPPASKAEILTLMSNLEEYINNNLDGIDPLIKMAVIHYQFECIHPFYDGNGRTGRILNVLYLVLRGLLDSPILYLSRFFNNNKSSYYRLLQEVRTNNNWEDWLLYILGGVEDVAAEILELIYKINNLVADTKEKIKAELPRLYSKELMDLIFFDFYTKNRYFQEGLGVSRKTAASYLNSLEEIGILSSEKIGKERIYKNIGLYKLISREI